MTDTKVARVGRRIAPGQMIITLMVAVALAAVLVSSAAGRAARVPESPVLFNLATAQADGFVYMPLTPNRILDTRFDLGLTGPLHSKTPRTFQVTGLHPANVNTNVPADAAAVTGNLTVDKQTAPGYISLTKTPQANPTTSSLNFPVGDTRANGVTAPLGTGGKLSVTYVHSLTTSTAHVIFDVTGYFVLGGSGEQGPAGPAGPSGAPGATGATGAAGPSGAPGATGPTGSTGPQGPAGSPGATGAVGPEGTQGAEGPEGTQGPEGPAGTQGPEGPAGTQGPEGPEGTQGPEGPAGTQGPEGPAGTQGPEGPAGTQGPEGPAGPMGSPGADGTDGVDGTNGTNGTNGADGQPGPQGTQGIPGVDGLLTYRAGTATLSTAAAGTTTVTFTNPLADTSYYVSITFTSDTNFGPHMDVYTFVASKTVNGFTIVLNTSAGNATAAPAGTTVDWLALPLP